MTPRNDSNASKDPNTLGMAPSPRNGATTSEQREHLGIHAKGVTRMTAILQQRAPAEFTDGPERTDDGGRPAELSAEARIVRDLGIPIRRLQRASESNLEDLHRKTIGLNELIGGARTSETVWQLLEEHLPPAVARALAPAFHLVFPALWSVEELEALGRMPTAELLAAWRDRVRRHGDSVALERILRRDADYLEIWQAMEGGDFDLGGRGVEYTFGMEHFQAGRWLGAQTLLQLLQETSGYGRAAFLDVLGGDGYVWRLHEGLRKLSEARMIVVDCDRARMLELHNLSAQHGARLGGLLAGDGGAVLLVVNPGSPATPALLFAPDPEGGLATSSFVLEADMLDELQAAECTRLVEGRADRGVTVPALLELVAEALRPASSPLLVTNDIARHMFLKGGVWGPMSREDGCHLSRTFASEQLDGVMFAYGTHHIQPILEAVREAYSLLRIGGTIVFHDFFDQGPVGRWFHEIVHNYSQTGHDYAHIGPIYQATLLLSSRFRNVEVFEMSDPFVFSLPDADAAEIRKVGLTYLIGMYGLGGEITESLDRFEEVVKEYLTYPEVDDVPLFSDRLVYVPRRAAVTRAVRADGNGELDRGDRELVQRLSLLFRGGFDELRGEVGISEDRLRQELATPSGERWGVPRELQEVFLDWAAQAGF